jgi:hypothetical protein
VHGGRDTSTVILYGNGVVRVYVNGDILAIAGQSLIDRVVDDLIHQMV